MIKNLRQYRTTPPSFDEIMGNDNPIPSFNDIMGGSVKKKEPSASDVAGKFAPGSLSGGAKSFENTHLSVLNGTTPSASKPQSLSSEKLSEPLYEQPSEGDEDPLGTLQKNVLNAYNNVDSKIFGANNTFAVKDNTATNVRLPEDNSEYASWIAKRKHLTDVSQQITNTINNGADISTKDAKKRLQQIAKTPLPNQNIDDLTDDEIINAVPQTATNQSIVNRYLNNRKVYKSIATAPTFEDAAVTWAKENADRFPSGIKEDLLKQLNTTSPDNKAGSVEPAQMGYLLSEFLNQDATKELAAMTPKNRAIYEAAKKKLFTKYQDYGIQRIASELSKQREGSNNGILNIITPGSVDKIAEENLKNGNWSKEEYDLYQSRKTDVLAHLRTPGLIENAGRSLGDMLLKDIPAAVKDVITLKPIRGNDVDDIKDAIRKQYTETQYEPKGGWHKLTQLVGDFGGQMAAIGATAKVLKGVGLSSRASNAAAMMLTMEHPIREEALKHFPDNPFKREAYTVIHTAINGAFGAMIAREKPIEGLEKVLSKEAKKELTDEVVKTINKFTEGQITADAAKQTIAGTFKGIAQKVGQYTGKTLEHNTVQALQMGGLQLVNDAIDKVFGARDVSYDDVGNDVLAATKTAFLGNLPLATLGAHADITGQSKISANAVYEMASDPIRYETLIKNLAVSDPKLKSQLSEALGNLKIAADLKKEMDGNKMVSGLKPEEKQKYLFQSLSQKVLEKQLEGTTDNVLRQKIKEQIKQSEKFNQRLIDKTPLEVKEPTSKEKEEGVKAYYEDEKNVKALAQKISKGLPLTDEDLQLHKNFPEQVETELQKIQEHDNNGTKKEPAVSEAGSIEENTGGGEGGVFNGEGRVGEAAATNETTGETTIINESTPKVNQPLRENTEGTKEQGVKEAVPENTADVGRGEAEAAAPVVREQPFQTKSGKYTVEYENGKRIVKDKEGNVIPEYNQDGSQNRIAKDVLRQHDKQYNYNFGERADTEKMPEVRSEEEYNRWVIENSNNPSEVAEVYHATEKETHPLSAKEQAIADHGIGKVKQASYSQFGDGNNINNNKVRAYFKKDGQSLDVIAKEISDHTGLDVEPQDIVDFIDRFPNGAKEALAKRDGEIRQMAATKFKELTGIDITDRIAKNAAEQGYTKEEVIRAEEEFGKALESESLPESEVKKWLEEESQKFYENDNEEINNLDTNGQEQQANAGEFANASEANRGISNTEGAMVSNPAEPSSIPVNENLPEGGTRPTAEAEGIKQNSPKTQSGEQPRRESGDEVKKTIATIRSYEGEFREGVKREIEKLGLTRDVENQQEAKQKAKEFIDSVGEDAALEAVRNNDVPDAAGAYIWNELIESTDHKLSVEKDPQKIRQLEERQAKLIQEFSRKALSGGRFASALNDIYQNSDLGYNVEKKIQEYKDLNGGEIPAEVEKKFRELDTELKEVRKKLAEAEEAAKKAKEEQAVVNIQEDVKRKSEAKKKEYQNKALDAIAKVRKKIKANAYSDVTGMVAIVDAGLVTIEKAIKAGIDISRAIEKGIAHIKGKLKEQGVDVWEKEQNFRDDVTAAFKESGVEVSKPKVVKGRLVIPKDVIRSLVEEGIDNIEDLTKAVHEIVQQELPDVTERQVRDAITDYGKTVNLNKEEIATKIRRMKRVGRIISGLEDIAEKKRPLKSGLQRDKLDAQERALQKELREAMKELPVDEQVLEAEQKTATDAAKQRLKNQIEDLQREIDKREQVKRSAKTIQDDAELKELRRQRDQLKAEHDKIFKNEEYKEKKRLEQAKLRTNRSIEDLQRRLKEGDFSKKEKPKQISDSELVKLKAEKLRLQDEYDKEFYKNKLKNRTQAQKTVEALWDAWGLTRLLRATIDFSFVLVQGGPLTANMLVVDPVVATVKGAFKGKLSASEILKGPKTVRDAFVNSLKFFASDTKTQQWLRNIKAQDWYPELKQSKLGLTETHAEVTAREELATYSDWANAVWNIVVSPLKFKSKEAYERAKELSPFKGFERAAVGYLDMLRVSKFLDGREMLREKGLTIEKDPKAYKDMADVVNTFTGRASLGPFEQYATGLTKMLFSPRNWASAIKIATPWAFVHFGKMRSGAEPWKPSVAQKMAIAEFSKFVGLTTSMVMLAAVRLNNDDDDNTSVEFDPRSSDFMKIKLGDTRVDPWGGKIQQIVFTSRIMMDILHDLGAGSAGGYKNNKGGVMPLGIPFKSGTKFDVSRQMMVNKLSPSAAILNKYLTARNKKDGTKVDEYGNEFSLKEEIKSSLYPIYFDTFHELLKDDPTALDGLLTFYAYLGGGVNKYENKKDKKKD